MQNKQDVRELIVHQKDVGATAYASARDRNWPKKSEWNEKKLLAVVNIILRSCCRHGFTALIRFVRRPVCRRCTQTNVS